jgi:hypothetical protein
MMEEIIINMILYFIVNIIFYILLACIVITSFSIVTTLFNIFIIKKRR